MYQHSNNSVKRGSGTILLSRPFAFGITFFFKEQFNLFRCSHYPLHSELVSIAGAHREKALFHFIAGYCLVLQMQGIALQFRQSISIIHNNNLHWKQLCFWYRFTIHLLKVICNPWSMQPPALFHPPQHLTVRIFVIFPLFTVQNNASHRRVAAGEPPDRDF